MNQSQIKYATLRADRVLASRKEAITAAHTTPAVKLTKEEKLEALVAGRFTVARGTAAYSWSDAVTFTDARDEVVDKAAIAEETAALVADHRTLIDELILGDNEQALALLKAFEA